MPIYTYRCQACGVQFERLQKFADKPLTRCPECRKGRVRRLLEAPAIVFKGSGWYKTDSRSNSTSTRSEKPSGDASGEKAVKSDKPAKKDDKPAKTDD